MMLKRSFIPIVAGLLALAPIAALSQSPQFLSPAPYPIPTGGNQAGLYGVNQGSPGPAANAWPVTRPDVRNTGTLAAGTLNAAFAVPLSNGEGVVGWTITGLTGSGATLVPEASNDGGTTWSAINALAPGSPTLTQALTTDQQFRVNGGGHTAVRLRVSVVGTGTIAIAASATSVGSLVALSAPAPVTPTGMVVTASVVTLPAGTSTPIIGANPARKSLRWMVTGPNPVTIAPGAGMVTAGVGWAYNGPSSPGSAGMWETFEGPVVPTNAFAAVSAAGSVVVVWEGQ